MIIYPSSGTEAWDAAIVNTLSPGDKVLMAETGHFATLWKGLAEKFKLEVGIRAHRSCCRRDSDAMPLAFFFPGDRACAVRCRF